MKRVAVITGVAGGIGRATARMFSQAGWTVVGIDRLRVAAPEGVDHFFLADVSREEMAEAVFAEISKVAAGVDCLINNAAILLCKPFLQTTLQEWDDVMASNLRSSFLSIRLAHPLLQKCHGSIVNVSSVHAVATSSEVAAYAASKGGLVALTRALAIELAPDQIRVNAVLPGATDTPMLHSSLQQREKPNTDLASVMTTFSKRQLMGRVGQPEEIARMILFLADAESSSFITGQAFVVDGGATARLSTE